MTSRPSALPLTSRRKDAGIVLVVVGACLVAGLVAGGVWAAIATPSLVANDTDLRGYFGRDAWFAIVAVVAGLLAGAAAWWRQRDDGLAAVAGLVAGGLVGAFVAWKLGAYLGPGWRDLGRAPPAGHTSLELRANDAVLLWPIASVLVYFVLLAGWPARRTEQFRQPEVEQPEISAES